MVECGERLNTHQLRDLLGGVSSGDLLAKGTVGSFSSGNVGQENKVLAAGGTMDRFISGGKLG
jgi:hypothetical protein